MSPSVALATLLPEWITVKCYILIGRVHCVSKIGMIPQHLKNDLVSHATHSAGVG